MKTMEPGSWPDRMNPTDALFWFMDKVPELRSTIGALVILERTPSRERMRAEFDRVSLRLPRMRQRVVEVPFSLAPPEWVADAQFDLDYHIRYVAVPEPGGMGELLGELSPLFATALDRDRPLWEAYVANGLLSGRGAVFVKMHHCVTDGVGGSRLFAELLKNRAADPLASAAHPLEPRSTAAGALLWRAVRDNTTAARGAATGVVSAAAAAALQPVATLSGIGQALRTAAGFGQELLARRATSPLHHQRSLSRQLSTFGMSLREIDRVRQRLSATNNDIVLTVVSGAMHRWHTSRGADVHLLRAMVPVSLRAEDDPAVGNRLALLAVQLPIGEPNPLHRLRAIQQQMGRVKADRRGTLYPWLARVMTAMPLAVAERLGRQQTNRTNFVCSNIPGPRDTCYLAGEVMEQIYPYAPLVGDHPIAIALYSYRDAMYVGLDVDPLSMDDLPYFRDALQESYEEILNVGREAAVGSRRRPVRARARLRRRQATPRSG